MGGVGGGYQLDNLTLLCDSRKMGSIVVIVAIAAILLGGVTLANHIAEAKSKSYKLKIEFTGFITGYHGKTTVTIKNDNTNTLLGKHTFDFKKLNKNECCDVKSSMTFEKKNSHTGDGLVIDAIDTGKNGGGATGYQLTFNKSEHSYRLH